MTAPADPNLSYLKAAAPTAKYGGAGGALGNHPLLNVILPALAGLRAGGLFGAAENGLGAYNNQRYNQALYAQQVKEDTKKDNTNMALTQEAVRHGLTQSYDANGNPIYLDPTAVKQAAEMAGNAQFVAGQQNQINGQTPSYGDLAPADQVRQSNQATILNPAIQSNQQHANYNWMGQNAPSSIPYGPGAGTQPPQAGPPAAGLRTMLPPMQNGQLDDGTGQPQAQTLQAGTSMQAPPPPAPLTPGQLFTSGQYSPDIKETTPALAQLQTVNNENMANSRGLATIAETGRHNRADEGIGRANAAAHMVSAQRSHAGPAFSLNGEMWNAMTPAQRTQWTQRTASGVGVPVVPSASQRLQLEMLRQQASPSNGIFGLGAHPGDPLAAARYNAYAPKYGLAPIDAAGAANGPIKSAADWHKQRHGK